jgi:hypothetical protein
LSRRSIASILPNITNREELREFALAPETSALSSEVLGRINDLWENNFYLAETPERATVSET